MINKIQKPITLLMLLLMLPFASVGEVVALTVDQSNKNDVVLLDENKKEATEVTTDETGVVDFYAGVTNGDTLRLTTNQPVELSTVDTGLTITPIDQTTYDLSWVKVGSNTSKVKLKTSGDSDLQLKLASKDDESTKTLLIQKALAVTEKTGESVPASESSKDEDTTLSTTVDETPKKSEEKRPDASAVKNDNDGEKAAIVAAADDTDKIKVNQLAFGKTPETLEYWQPGQLDITYSLSGLSKGKAVVRLLVSDDYTQLGQQASGMLPHMPGATEKDGSIVVDGRNYVYRDYTIDINSSATTTTITMDTLVGGGSNATYTMPLMSDKNLKLQVFDPETGKQIGDTVDKTIKYTTPEMKLIKGVNALDAGGDRTYSFDDKVSKTVIGYDSSGKTPKVSGSDASGTSLVAYEFIPYLDYKNNTSKNFTFNDFKITDVLPEGAVFNQANNPGWTYDEATRTATYVGNTTDRVGNLYGTSKTESYYNSSYAKKITLNLTFPNTEEGKTIPNTADVHVSDPKKANINKQAGVTYDPYSAYLDQDGERNATDDKSILTEVLEGRQEGNILSKERLLKQPFIDSRANRESGATSYIVNVNAPDSTQWSDFKLTDALRDDRFVYNRINIDALDITGTVNLMGIDESGKEVTIVSNIKKRLTAYSIPTGITQIYLKGNGPISVTKAGTYITMKVYVSAKNPDKVLLDDDNEDSKLIRNDAILDATYANSANKAHSTQTAYQYIKKIEAVQNVGGGSDFTLEYGKTERFESECYYIRGSRR